MPVTSFMMLLKDMVKVNQALTCNSAHTKHALRNLCPEGSPGYGNIRVLRHPDHNIFENAADMTLYWVSWNPGSSGSAC